MSAAKRTGPAGRAFSPRYFRWQASGRSLRRIAELFNHDALLTAHGGVRWHASTVQSVLGRLSERTEAK